MPDPSAYVLRIGLALFASTTVSYSSMAEVPVAFMSKRLVARQVSQGLCEAPRQVAEEHDLHSVTAPYADPSLAYALSVSAINMPVQLTAVTIFGTILYFFASYAETADRWAFWIWTLFFHEVRRELDICGALDVHGPSCSCRSCA